MPVFVKHRKALPGLGFGQTGSLKPLTVAARF